MPANPRAALKTIIKTATLARQYLQIVEAGHDLSGLPFVESALLIGLRDTAQAVHTLAPWVRAMQPKAPWLKLALFEGVDPLRPEHFFAAYPDGVVNEVIRQDVLPLGRAATRMLAEIEQRGVPEPSLATPRMGRPALRSRGVRSGVRESPASHRAAPRAHVKLGVGARGLPWFGPLSDRRSQ